MRLRVWQFLPFLLSGCASPPPAAAPGSADSPYPRIRVGETLDCNKLVNYAKPVYPKEARKKRIHGSVRLRAVITKTGEPRDFEVLKGDPLRIPAALNAAKQWRYTPCLLNSEPVEVITDLELSFNLSQ
jgi:TonB family protein